MSTLPEEVFTGEHACSLTDAEIERAPRQKILPGIFEAVKKILNVSSNVTKSILQDRLVSSKLETKAMAGVIRGKYIFTVRCRYKYEVDGEEGPVGNRVRCTLKVGEFLGKGTIELKTK